MKKIKCSYCHSAFPNKQAYGGHVKHCKAKRATLDNYKKILNSLRPLKANDLPTSQPERKTPVLNGWKDIANFLKTHPQTAMRWYKKSKRTVYPMPVKFTGGAVFSHVEALSAWSRGELKSYYETLRKIWEIDRDMSSHWEKRTKEDMETIVLLSERKDELMGQKIPKEARGWKAICEVLSISV